jgi:hypothetical protein
VARDDWRLRIELGEQGAAGLLERLHLWRSDAGDLARELEDSRLAVTHDDGTVFVYASTSLELERARAVIANELGDLGLTPKRTTTEHWLGGEERWDDDAPGPSVDEQILAEGHAPWEVRIQASDRRAARELADRLETEGYGVVRRWTYVIAGCSSRAEAQALAARLHGEVEPGGELVWETTPGNPFAVVGGLGS